MVLLEMSPFFSVVIPTYNRVEFLLEAVESVITQTFNDFEVIIVDDGSTDTTVETIGRLADNRITLVQNDRGKGGAGTRNAGIFRATGSWIAFLDDDDIWFPEKLQKQHDYLKTVESEVGMIYTGHVRFKESIAKVYQAFIPTLEGQIFRELLYKNSIAGFYSVAIRRDILMTLEGLDERFPAQQDHDLYTRVARDYKVACLPEPLVYVRFSEEGRITTNVSRRLKSSQLFFEKYESDATVDRQIRAKLHTNIMMFAFAAGEWKIFVKHFIWYPLSLFADPKGFIEASKFLARTVRDYVLSD